MHACVLHSSQGCRSGKALQQRSNSMPVDSSQLQRLCIITEPQLLISPTCHRCEKDVVESSTAAAHATAHASPQGCGRLR